ncbi:unknown [Sutterella sp. CAG:351]|nr:unknown [Sutterella sp. CAG:351]
MPIPVRAQEKASGVRPKCDVGKTAGIMTPASRISPPTAMGRRAPTRSTIRPHGMERKVGKSARRLISRPTLKEPYPCESASRLAVTRTTEKVM